MRTEDPKNVLRGLSREKCPKLVFDLTFSTSLPPKICGLWLPYPPYLCKLWHPHPTHLCGLWLPYPYIHADFDFLMSLHMRKSTSLPLWICGLATYLLPWNQTKKSTKKTIHAVFFTSILFISIIRLKSGKNKHNLSITKAQILPQDEQKNEQNRAWAYKTIVVIVGIWKITFLSTTSVENKWSRHQIIKKVSCRLNC